MKLLRTLKLSLRALLAHRVRTLLAVAGVAVGVAAVALTSAIGAGAEAQLLRGFSERSAQLLVIRPTQLKRMPSRRQVQGMATTLTLADGAAIAQLPTVAQAAPAYEALLRMRGANGTIVAKLIGSTRSFCDVRHYDVVRGRLFDGEEERSAARVAVVGARVAASLFGDEDPLGRTIRLRGVELETIGLLAAKGATESGADSDNQILVPLETALRRVFNTTYLTTLFISVSAPEAMDAAESDIRELLRSRHRLDGRAQPEDDFAVQNQHKLVTAREETAQTMRWVTLAVAAVSLLVGGTGILALMLLSVEERTAEIGLRMALGGRPRDILAQFFAESSVLAFAGGVLGLILGGLGTLVVRLGTAWPAQLSASTVLISLALVALVGIGAGAWPARKASLLTPVTALGRE